jgi:hypothetical protein
VPDILDSVGLRLTVDRKGTVWQLLGSSMPRSTGQDVPTFLDKHSFEPDDHVRVVGVPANANLIVELYYRRLKKVINQLEVCSPLCCHDPSDRDDPAILLFSTRRFCRPPSLGGWHEFAIRDYPSYLLCHYFSDMASSMKLSPTTKILDYPAQFPKDAVFHHPAWPYLSFVEGICAEACAELISHLLDPRWYVDPAPDGDESTRMEQFLGLYSGIAKDRTSVRARRYQLVLDCWKNGGTGVIHTDGPRGFVWRSWITKGGGEKGDIAASKCFINYLRMTWSMSLCLTAQASRLFVPHHFFQRQDEVEAFLGHLTKFNPQP